MAIATMESEPKLQESNDLRTETQGLITFYHYPSTFGYWFNAGEIDVLIRGRGLLDLPEPKEKLPLGEEFRLGPVHCPFCGSGSRLFEMTSYLVAEVRMGACHVCHGRWIGHANLMRLMDQAHYGGLIGSIRRLLTRRSARGV